MIALFWKIVYYGCMAVGAFAVTMLGILAAEYEISLFSAHRQVFNYPTYRLHPEHKVSVIIPAYNEEKYIADLIISGQEQTYQVHEIIVAVSGDDRTAEIAQTLGAKTVDVPAGNISLARNEGAAMASGDVLVFADADVVFGGRFLEDAVSCLASGKAACHPKEVLHDSGFWDQLVWTMQVIRPAWNTTRCVAVWREVFDAVGGYDVNCNPMNLGDQCREDLDFGRRIMAQYGRDSIGVLEPAIATSARRYKRFGLAGLRHFDETPRALKG